MCTVGLYDTIEMEPSREPGVRLRCDRPDVPVDGSNLIVRAGEALRQSQTGTDVLLQKKIPMGGGLGGGSSNAAFALQGFNEIWNLKYPISKLAAIGARLGSDVPFFLHGPSSICEGRGERVTSIGPPLPKFVVLILPKLSMSTPAVYRRFDEMKLGSKTTIERQPNWEFWQEWPAGQLLNVLQNDLETPAFSLCPALGELRHRIERQIGQTVRMSGSGSTLFTLADDITTAEALAARIQQPAIKVELCGLSPNSAEI